MLVSEEAGSEHSLVPSSHNTLDKAGETEVLTFERLYLSNVCFFSGGRLFNPLSKTKHVIITGLKTTRNCISFEQGQN